MISAMKESLLNVSLLCIAGVHLKIMRYTVLSLALFFHCGFIMSDCNFQDCVVVVAQVFRGHSIIE